MEQVMGGGPAVGCILGAASLIGGLVATAFFPPAATLAGALWVGTFLADVTNTTLSCAEWAAGV